MLDVLLSKRISPDWWDAEMNLTIKSAVAFQLMLVVSVAGAKVLKIV